MRLLILASGSPRRHELIAAVARDVDIIATDVDESVPDGTPPDVMVRDVALRKALAGRQRAPDAVVIAADTTVAVDGEWLAKPADDAEAARMLTSLAGREHLVFTGVAVGWPGAMLSDVTMSVVTIASLTRSQVDAYVVTGEGADKAGAYSIQGNAGDIVTAVEGCYTNVVGLPLCALATLLARAGVATVAQAPACGFRENRRCPHPIWWRDTRTSQDVVDVTTESAPGRAR